MCPSGATCLPAACCFGEQVQSSKNKIINKQYCYIDLQTSFFGKYFDIISINVVQCQMSNVLAISMQAQIEGNLKIF
jgi:hypothetical protein